MVVIRTALLKSFPHIFSNKESLQRGSAEGIVQYPTEVEQSSQSNLSLVPTHLRMEVLGPGVLSIRSPTCRLTSHLEGHGAICIIKMDAILRCLNQMMPRNETIGIWEVHESKVCPAFPSTPVAISMGDVCRIFERTVLFLYPMTLVDLFRTDSRENGKSSVRNNGIRVL